MAELDRKRQWEPDRPWQGGLTHSESWTVREDRLFYESGIPKGIPDAKGADLAASLNKQELNSARSFLHDYDRHIITSTGVLRYCLGILHEYTDYYAHTTLDLGEELPEEQHLQVLAVRFRGKFSLDKARSLLAIDEYKELADEIVEGFGRHVGRIRKGEISVRKVLELIVNDAVEKGLWERNDFRDNSFGKTIYVGPEWRSLYDKFYSDESGRVPFGYELKGTVKRKVHPNDVIIDIPVDWDVETVQGFNEEFVSNWNNEDNRFNWIESEGDSEELMKSCGVNVVKARESTTVLRQEYKRATDVMGREMSKHATKVLKIGDKQYIIRYRNAKDGKSRYALASIDPERIHELRSRFFGGYDISFDDIKERKLCEPQPYINVRDHAPTIEIEGGRYKATWPN
jgi:hypothetical protein